MKIPLSLILSLLLGSRAFASDLTVLADGHDGFGLKGAAVAVIFAGGTQLKGTTDTYGVATLKNVPRGAFSLKITAPGYADFSNADPENEIRSDFETYSFHAVLGDYIPGTGSIKILSSFEFPLGQVSNFIQQYTSTQWPNFSNACGALWPSWNASSGLISGVYSPVFASELNLKCETNLLGEFAPRLSLDFTLLNGRHQYKFDNDVLKAKDENRISPALTAIHNGMLGAPVYSANLIESSLSELFVQSEAKNFIFEYKPDFCLDANQKPITDPALFDDDHCKGGTFIHQAGTNETMAYSEDVVSRSTNDAGEPVVTVHYRLKKLWFVITTTADGKAPSTLADANIYVTYLPLVVSATSGNPILSQDHFSSALNLFADNFKVSDSAGKAVEVDTMKSYLRFSDAYYAGLKALTAAESDAETLAQKHVIFSDERVQNSLTWVFGFNRAPPSNVITSWIKFPWPDSLPITANRFVSRGEYEPKLAFRAKDPLSNFRGEPNGNFNAVLQEMKQNFVLLGSGKLQSADLLSLILEASDAFKNADEQKVSGYFLPKKSRK